MFSRYNVVILTIEHKHLFTEYTNQLRSSNIKNANLKIGLSINALISKGIYKEDLIFKFHFFVSHLLKIFYVIGGIITTIIT